MRADPHGRNNLTHCVACGKKLTEVGPLGGSDHHCDPDWEAAVERRGQKARSRSRKPTYNDRLEAAFNKYGGYQ